MNIRRLLWTAAWACNGKGAAATSPSTPPGSFDIKVLVAQRVRHEMNTNSHDRRTQMVAPGAFENTLYVRGGSTNKKYTGAAAEAMKTMNSFTFGTSRQSTIPTLHSESALMDKETNAIYWQGGADILSTSLTNPYLTQRGVRHVKATILSVLLWMWVWGNVSRYLTSTYFATSSGNVRGTKLFAMLPFISSEKAPPVLRKVASFITPVVQFFLLLFHSLLYLRLPQYSPNVIAVTVLLYLLESYSCSTRRYLSHAMNAPDEVEAYLERIRNVRPIVTWKVRCFHYEDRELWKNMKGMRRIWDIRAKKRNKTWDRIAKGGKLLGIHLSNSRAKPASISSSDAIVESPILWATKKVITHQAVGTYKFGRWEDRTLASLWKRSESFSPTSHEAPFSKLTLSKLLVLKDKNTRDDYFAQQAAFVMLEGRRDVHAHIYVLFTLLGLSLPYRIWFAKHCDEIRVTVVKEVGTEDRSSKEAEVSQRSSWFPGKWGWGLPQSSIDLESKRNQELFRKSMQQFSLYDDNPTSADKLIADQTVMVDADAQSDTVLPVEKFSIASVIDVAPSQEKESASLNLSEANASSHTTSTFEAPIHHQTGTLGDGSTNVEDEEQATQTSSSINIDSSPESIEENIMDNNSPLE